MPKITLTITGPLWSATAEIVKLADPKDNFAWRSLFVDRIPHGKLLLPGTILALVSAKRVVVRPGLGSGLSFAWNRPQKWNKPITLGDDSLDDLRSLLDSGRLALLLLQRQDKRNWLAGSSAARCLASEINLDVMNPASSTTVAKFYKGLRLTALTDQDFQEEKEKRTGAAGLAGALTVHGSGLSIYGTVNLPWEAQDKRLAAPFFLQQLGDGPDELKLTLETERLTAEERDNWLSSWQNLAYYLTPNNPILPSAQPGDPPHIPHWATLEVANPLAIPQLFWQIQTWGWPELGFERGEFELSLADRQPHGVQPPTSMARLSPQIEVVRESGDLVLKFDEQSASDAPLVYVWTRTGGETFKAENPLELAFDPVETPRFLRQRQALPAPEWTGGDDPEPVEPAVLWGFMPLADGWAQLPVPNLTEQIYLDAKLANLPDPTQPAAETTPLLQGAVTFDNDDHGTLRPPANEQPFSVTLTNVQAVSGTWTLTPGAWVWSSDNWELQEDAASGYHIEGAQLCLQEPELIIDGLLWFSTGKPTVGDALPNLDDWLAGLRPITLRTSVLKPLFPPPVVVNLAQFGFQRSDTGSAQLQAWSWQYRAKQDTLNELFKSGVLPQDAFSSYAPLIWRRHPHVPLIQAMPMTQNQVPPSYPSPSRQLLPFVLPVAEPGDETAIPDDVNAWVFGVTDDNGAQAWASCQNEATSPAEWQQFKELGLVALSLPGLVLHPAASMPSMDQTLGLGWQYRFDLPYLDEVNALAQLPKVEPNLAQATILLAPVTPPPPQPPLARENYEAHWQRLAELARLAAADAVEALKRRDDGQVAVQHLVEPYEWPVEPELKLDEYPGSLTLADQEESLVLTTQSALEGVSGNFAETNNELTLLDASDDTDSNPYILTASSMAAHTTTVNGKNVLRDQRGLIRCASAQIQLGGGRFLKTTVQREQTPVELTSTLDPVTLQLTSASSGPAWQLWFRDLPLRENQFKRLNSTGDTDINNPNALAVDRDYLTGYEWRLGSSDTSAGPLLFHDLHFYPLRLQKLDLGANGVSEVNIVGRLQLPLAPVENAVELTDLSNVVVLTFEADEASGDLQFSAIRLDTDNGTSGEWPLAIAQGELTDAPRLLWTDVSKVGDGLQIRDVQLEFFLFGARWSIPVDALQFPNTGTYTYDDSTPSSTTQSLTFDRLELTLNLEPDAPEHTIDISLGVNLGRQSAARAAFAATVKCIYLSSGEDGEWHFDCQKALLFDDLTVEKDESKNLALVFHNNTFQFSWRTYVSQDPARFQFLPGMHLDSDTDSAPGFAVLSFSTEQTAVVPRLRPDTAFLETLLFFKWGAFLQSSPPSSDADRIRKAVFGSSAGSLVLAYTAVGSPDPNAGGGQETTALNWQETFMLNGFLEVKNLISWPEGLVATNPRKTDWLLPAIPDQGAPLNHLRHTIRILFNQHNLPAGVLEMRTAEPEAEKLLYDLRDDVVWQFLAVVEHQLTLVSLDGNIETAQVNWDQRWTTLQEVRLFTPPGFKVALDRLKNEETILPVALQSIEPVLEIKFPAEGKIQVSLTADETLLSEDLWAKLQVQLGSKWEDKPKKGFPFEPGSYKVSWRPALKKKHNCRLVVYPKSKEGQVSSKSFTLPDWGKTEVTIEVNEFRVRKARRTASLSEAFGGYYGEQMRAWLAGGDAALDKLAANTLIVEASAPHWINQKPINRTEASAIRPTVLQYLPTGSQLAILSVPDDYAPTDPRDPQWLLLPMPFLGRLQNSDQDGLDDSSQAHTPIQIDSILCLQRQAQMGEEFSSLALALTHHGHPQQDVTIRLSEFDTDVGRRFARLDTLSLQQNWLCIQKPPPEKPPGTLASVMATLADTPARLSRATALKNAFDSFQRDEPPVAQLKWWHDSLLAIPAVKSGTSQGAALNGWVLTGIHLKGSSLTQALNVSPVYHAAATQIAVLPDRPDHTCVSFAVSPYLGLGFKPGPRPEDARLSLWSSELLCLHRATGQLAPVASRLWEQQMFDEPIQDSDVAQAYQGWALETQRRLNPDSPIAILRLREIRQVDPGQSLDQELLSTTYRFAIVSRADDPTVRLGRRVFPLRAEIDQLHFAEGQFGGFELPSAPKPFELAPPQTTGVLPVYEPKRPDDGWQWGLSALRLSLAYSDGKTGIAGPLPTDTNTTLWWQALQQRLQYKPGAAGLPSFFRAPAIKSLLPVLPRPAMPMDVPDAQELPGWQPILPGALRYWLVGARPGIMLALRHQLLRQRLTSGVTTVMVSGSTPVQHRVPRPIPLPLNAPARPQVALQTWASRFDAQNTVLASAEPADEAFFASYVAGNENIVPAKRMPLTLEDPVRGEIKPDWDGAFKLRVQDVESGSIPLTKDVIKAAVIVNGVSFACALDEELIQDDHLTCRVDDSKFQELKNHLASQPAGCACSLQLCVSAPDDPGNEGFRQTLNFPLRVTNEGVVPLPLAPRFIHFEDPEYNRRLASVAVQASGATMFNGTSYAVTFAADRRDYNPDSSIAWRLDLSDPKLTGYTATLLVQRVRAEDPSPVTLILKPETADDLKLTPLDSSHQYTLEGGRLYQCSLLDFRVADADATPALLKPDDTLLFQLSVEGGAKPLNLRLTVNIVEAPVIPVPEAAYALLRWRQTVEGVECVRFAWSPQPSRVELVCAQDLLTGVVRRRAVFQWQHSVRPGTDAGYALQKITQTGSTHFPDPEGVEQSGNWVAHSAATWR